MRSLSTVITAALLTACSGGPAVEQSSAGPKSWVVCAEQLVAVSCDFTGADAIQEAVDHAQSGDTIRIKAGLYQPQSYRDTPFQELIIRGFTLIENRDLNLVGEGEVLIDGRRVAASAFVTKNSSVRFRNIALNDFRWGIEEDDTYDGHGIFIIGGNVTIEDVAMRNIQKMGLSVHGAAKVTVTNLQITQSHLGVWANETSVVDIRDSLFQGSESCGLGAYDNSRVTITGSIFAGNLSDGIYASDQASVSVRDTIVVDNKPIGVNADKQGHIQIDHSYLSGNDKAFSDTQVSIGKAMLAIDPRVSAH